MSAPSAKKCEPLCGACVPGNFFTTSPQLHSYHISHTGRIISRLQHRSHRQTSPRCCFTCQKQGCRNPPAPHRFPARLLSPKPTIHTTNGSHIHSHIFRSRILHTGTTLYPPLPPTLASVNNYSPPPHLHFRLLASRTCQPSASKVRASLRRVCPRIFLRL